MVKENALYLAGHQARSPGQVVLKSSELPEGFWEKDYKDRVREEVCGVCDQFVDVLLTGWW